MSTTKGGGAGRVDLRQAVDPFVLALDVGSTASRGDVYDATGQPVEGGRHKVEHQFHTAGDGTSTIDPDAVVDEIGQIIDALAVRGLKGRIGGVAMDTFASSLVGVGADGRACTLCFTYADSRCGGQVVALRKELDEAAVHQRTGTRLHSSYLAPRLRWLRETDPDTFSAAKRWMSLGEYVYLRLLGVTAAGTAVAAWTGMLDRRTGAWDAELLAAAGVEVDQLSEVRDQSDPLREVSADVSSRWPARPGSRWSPTACPATSASERTTSRPWPPPRRRAVPCASWCSCPTYYRPVCGATASTAPAPCSAERSTMSAAPSAGWSRRFDSRTVLPSTRWPALNRRRALRWCCRTSQGSALLAGRPTRGRPLPASRPPRPDRNSHAACWKGVAISYARIADQLRSVSGQAPRILASGRVTQDVPSFLQILADVLEAPVVPVTTKRATLHGTALLGLEVLAPDVERVPAATAETLAPVAERGEYYRTRREEYQRLYEAIVGQPRATMRSRRGHGSLR